MHTTRLFAWFIFGSLVALAAPEKHYLYLSSPDGVQTEGRLKGNVDLSAGGHGWVAFSLDGKYAWCHTPDVIDAHTKKVIAVLKDEHGKRVSSSKFIEVHLRDGKVIRMGNEFGLGRAHLTKPLEQVQR